MRLYYLSLKWKYTYYTLFEWFVLWLKQIDYSIPVFFVGFISIYKTRQSFIKIGKHCRFSSLSDSNLIGINHKCILSTHSADATLVIGEKCGFSGTTIGCFKSITIGNNVRCGANTVITDSDWHLDDSRSGKPSDVVIEDNVWLGYGVIVLKGVHIGKNTVIGAGSVVTKNIPANVVAAGNPCVILKHLETK